MNNDNIQPINYSLLTYEDLVVHITTLNCKRSNAIEAAIERHHPIWYHTVVDDLEVIDRENDAVKAHLYEHIRNHAESQAAHDPPFEQQRAIAWIPDGIDLNYYEEINRENCNHTFKVAQISDRLVTTKNLHFLDLIESLDAVHERTQNLLYAQAREHLRQARVDALHFHRYG